MEKILKFSEVSNTILVSLKKRHKFKEKTRLHKINELVKLKKKFKLLLTQNPIPLEQGTEILKRFDKSLALLKATANEVEKIEEEDEEVKKEQEEDEQVEEEQEEEEEEEEEQEEEEEKELNEGNNSEGKMATILETIKTVSSLVPSYDGSGDNLSSFISALKAVKTILTNDNTAAAVQVVLSKLSGKARAAVGENPQNFDTIIRELESKCVTKTSPDVFIAKLQELKQVGDVNKFTDEVEKLTFQLERAYITEKIPVDTANKMAVKQGVKALYSGIRNSETKILLKAAEFTTLTAAIEKAIENEKSIPSTQLMFVRRGQAQRGLYRGNRIFPCRGNYRGNSHFRRNPRENFQNRNQNLGNGPNFHSSRGRRPYRGNFQSRIYYANNENSHQANTTQQQQAAVNVPQGATQPNMQQPSNFLGQLQRYIQ